MAYEQFGKEHLALTKVIEKYFGADAWCFDISCLDVARAVMEAGYEKPVRCKDCEYCEIAFDDYWCNYNWSYAPPGKPKLTRADGFCHNGERREGE